MTLIGVGMPAALLLDEFGSQVWSAFGHPPYLVGSATQGKEWRDVDVRLILPDDEYAAWGFGPPERTHNSGKWVSLVLAYSALGKSLTGLPIDFQIQQQTFANERYEGDRHALGLIDLRTFRPPEPPVELARRRGGLPLGKHAECYKPACGVDGKLCPDCASHGGGA